VIKKKGGGFLINGGGREGGTSLNKGKKTSGKGKFLLLQKKKNLARARKRGRGGERKRKAFRDEGEWEKRGKRQSPLGPYEKGRGSSSPEGGKRLRGGGKLPLGRERSIQKEKKSRESGLVVVEEEKGRGIEAR